MTKIIYTRDSCRVTMAGHAGSAPAGEDLVCAGLSSLLRVLVLAAEHGHGIAQVESGHADIRLVDSYQNLLDYVCDAFEWMAHEYPDFVSYECRGVG